MRSRTFEVPLDAMGDFAQIVDDNELTNELNGVADNGDIIVNVDYEPEEKNAINELHELIDQHNDDREDDEDDDEDEDED